MIEISSNRLSCSKDVLKMLEGSSISQSIYKPDCLTSYGYSEIVEYFDSKYKEAKISRTNTIGYLFNRDEIEVKVLKKYKLDEIKLYPSFYETLEILSQFPELGKGKKKWLFMNDIYGMSLLSCKCMKYLNKRTNVKVLLSYTDTLQHRLVDTIESIIPAQSPYTYVKASPYMTSNEIYSKELITEESDSGGRDFILIQNYLSAQVNASEEYNTIKSFLSKIMVMISLQNKNGNGMIKINNIYLNITVKIIKLISICYDNVYLYKCKYTSNLVNENYLILQNFRFGSKDLNKDAIINVLNEIVTVIDNLSAKETVLDILDGVKVDDLMKRKIFEFNTLLNEKKLDTLITTLRFESTKDDKILIKDKETKAQETKGFLNLLKK
jgi:hypothetical protein